MRNKLWPNVIGTFRDTPIKRKLMVVTVLTTGASIILSGAGIMISDAFLFRSYLERDLSALTKILAENTTAALAFDDPGTATEALGSLRAKPHVVAACIYSGNQGSGTQGPGNQGVFARYARADAGPCPPPARGSESKFTLHALTVTRPIVLNRELIGTLVLVYDLGELYERAEIYGSTVLGVLLLSSLIAFRLSSTLRDMIATPITKLAVVSSTVEATRDYSIRAEKLSNDELGVLVEAFNSMLGGIQSRDDELLKALLARESALIDAGNTRDLLQTTLASIGDGVISTDVGGRIVFANRAAQGMLRCSETEIRGRPLDQIVQLVNEVSGEKVESLSARVLREGTVVTLDDQAILKIQGQPDLPIEHVGAPIRGDTGTVHGTVLVFRDVTTRRRAEATSRLLASIVESSYDAIIGHSLDGTITSWNGGAERMFGYTAAEVVGRHSSVITAEGTTDEIPLVLRRIAQGENVGPYQALRRKKNGETIDISLTFSPLHDSAGRITGASKICRDITEQVRAAERLSALNRELKRTNEDLARSNDDLERFAFIASHDLQEPLRMIAIFSQLLIRSSAAPHDEQSAVYVSNILEGTSRMRDLLKDLLAFTEIGARQDMPAETVDLNAVVATVRKNLKESIDETGALITATELPALNAREAHFIPLFQNLIGNAIKYRGEAPPRISISFERFDDHLRFAVADNGIGIEPEYHDKIFVAFKRLHGKDIPGTGIGLAICQRVVERYGGNIWVESAKGRGSTFFFSIPDITVRS